MEIRCIPKHILTYKSRGRSVWIKYSSRGQIRPTPWRRVLKKLIIAQLITSCLWHKKAHYSIQKPSYGFCPEPDESSAHPHTHFFKINISIILPSTPVSEAVSSPQVSERTVRISPMRATKRFKIPLLPPKLSKFKSWQQWTNILQASVQCALISMKLSILYEFSFHSCYDKLWAC
jgi:hypothetical protein